MTFVKIKDEEVIDTVNGLKPDGYVDSIKDWEFPTAYPYFFYNNKTSAPIYTVIDGNAHEMWDFTLKPIEQIKSSIYGMNQVKRCKMQLGSFDFNGSTINLIDRDDANNINNIRTIVGNRIFKIGEYDWITLTPADIEPFKTSLDLYVQPSFDWEMEQYDLVNAMTTVDELKTYYDSMW